MTIARDSAAQPGIYGDESGTLRWWDGSRWTSETRAEALIPAEVRTERLDAQIRSFERGGYRLETRAGNQAVLVKPRQRRPVRDAALVIATVGLSLIPLALGARRIYHRVIITVDSAGAIRFA